MGIDIAAYRARIGRYNACKVFVSAKAGSNNNECKCAVIVAAAIISILLIIGNVEINPGPTSGSKSGSDNNNDIKDFMIQINDRMNGMSEQLRIILSQNEEVRAGHKELVEANKVLDGKIAGVKSDVNLVKYSYKEYEKEVRRNNLVIFGVDELGYERNIDTCYIVLDILAKFCGMNISENVVNNAYRLGRGRRRPIILKLNNFFVKEHILENVYKLKGSKIVIENDYTKEVREVRKCLVNFMKKARQQGMRASISHDKLRINGRFYDLEFLKKNDVPRYNETYGKKYENSRNGNRSRSSSPNRRMQFEDRNFVRRAASEESISVNAAVGRSKAVGKDPNWRLESDVGVNDIRNYMNRGFRSPNGRERMRCNSVERRVWSRDGDGTNSRGRNSPEVIVSEQRAAESNQEGAVGGIPAEAEKRESRRNYEGVTREIEGNKEIYKCSQMSRETLNRRSNSDYDKSYDLRDRNSKTNQYYFGKKNTK